MKFILLAAFAFASESAFARQYIQCSSMSDTTDVAVVNLPVEKEGTLFLSSGMQNDESERLLASIELEKAEHGIHRYKVVNEAGEGFVLVPSEVIGVASKFFLIELAFANLSFEFGCFSAIYPELN